MTLPADGETTYSNSNEQDSVWWLTCSGTKYSLTLNGADITNTDTSSDSTRGIDAQGDLELVLQKTNTVTAAANDLSYGIYVDGDLTVTGEGTLTATGGTASGSSYGVNVNGNLAVKNGCLKGVGGKAEMSEGVHADLYTSISGNGEIEGIGGEAFDSQGVSFKKTITVTGGKLTGTGGKAEHYSYGVYIYPIDSDSNIILSSGSISGIGGEADSSFGVCLNGGSIMMEGGSITGTGGKALDISRGVIVQDLTIRGGSITGTGGTSEYFSGGITVNHNITANGGSLTGTGGKAEYNSIGVYCNLQNITVNGGSLTGIAGSTANGTMSSNGSYGVYVAEGQVNFSKGIFKAQGNDYATASNDSSPDAGENQSDLVFNLTPSASKYRSNQLPVDPQGAFTMLDYVWSHTHKYLLLVDNSYSDAGGTGGGSSSSGSNVTTEVSKPTESNPTPPTVGVVKPPVSVDKNGGAKVTITDKEIQSAIDKALAQAKKDGTTANGIAVSIDLTGLKTAFNTLPLTLSKGAYQKLVDAGVRSMSIRTAQLSLSLDLETLKTILSSATGDVTIRAAKADKSKFSQEAQKALGSRPAYDLTITSGGTTISDFGKGRIAIAIPYALSAGESGGSLWLAFVDGTGKVRTMTQSSYDANSKSVIGSTNHFTVFGIVSQAAPAFTDVAGHWAQEDIPFVVNRGMFSGTSATTFSPDTGMTRGMFVTALGRLANADVSAYKTSSFSDVAAGSYYLGYIEWANKNSIVNGVGDGNFAPDQSITREQMAVIMQNYAKVIGFTLPNVHAENTFADSASIAAWAKDAVKQMQMAGILSGKTGNVFDPQGTATRAEVSAVLRRFVELRISIDTAQGWTMNESGQWMYIQDGKRVTGNKTIGGKSYTFDQYGVTADLPKNRNYTTYTVQKGDSFWSIARKYKVSMFELATANGKTIFSIIYAGDVLKMPQQ